MMDREKALILEQIEAPGIIPVMRLDNTDKIFPLLDALLEGGVNCAELTMTIPNALDNLKRCRERYDGRMILGMGTVLDASQTDNAMAAGAQFLVSPFPAFEALSRAKEQNIPFLMGAFSPYEVYQAHRAGADYVKIFPVNCLPLQYIKDLKGPLPQVKFIPTGGITLEQIEKLFKAGVAAMGIGGALIDKQCIENNDWDGIRKRAEQFVDTAIASKYKKSLTGNASTM